VEVVLKSRASIIKLGRLYIYKDMHEPGLTRGRSNNVASAQLQGYTLQSRQSNASDGQLICSFQPLVGRRRNPCQTATHLQRGKILYLKLYYKDIFC
jgi:hypothetical protein